MGKKIRLMLALLLALGISLPLPAQRVTLNVRNVPLKTAFGKLKKQTGYTFVYFSSDIDPNKKVSVEAIDKPLSEVMASLLSSEKALTYEIRDRQVIIKRKADAHPQSPTGQVQKRKAAGRVLDEQGEPVIGASIREKGTRNATVTGLDGRYSMEAGSGATLVVSYIGYKDKEVKAGDNVDIVLKGQTSDLDEIVVVGYTTQRKGLLTGSVASMKVGEELEQIPTTSAGNLLVGKLAGVNVTTPDALPGQNPSISIRTTSSWNAQDVMYVIDGVIRNVTDFNNLSPNEIDDITVLKDAASAAIYGSRSAGGVIIVTTKRGKIGKPTIRYSYNYSFNTRTKNEDLTNARQVGEIYNYTSYDSDPAGWRWTDEELNYIDGVNGSWGYDKLDAVWQTPSTQTHNFSVEGGSERIRYFGGMSYVKQDSYMRNLGYKKYNVRMNVTADITNDLQVFTSFGLSNNFKKNAVFEDAYNEYSYLRVFEPDQPVYTDGGQYVDIGWVGNLGAWVDGLGGYNKDSYLKPQLYASATYKAPFLKGLSAKLSYSRTWTHSVNKKYYTNYDMVVVKRSGDNSHIWSTSDADVLRTVRSTWVSKEYLEKTSNWDDDKQLNFQINYDNTFANLHHVSAAFVTEWYEGHTDGVYGGRETFPVYRTDQFWAASGARADTWGGGPADAKNGRMSYIGQFSYSYANKYLLNFSFREDGSMNFAPGHRWGFFPAGSAGWIVSEEPFFSQRYQKYIQFLKLRLSVGLTGNDSVGGWQWQESYVQGKYAYFGTSPAQHAGITYGNVVNTDLTWEKALSWNWGLDVNFLDHFSFSFDYWYRNSYDILGNRQTTLPSTFSMTMPAENYGEIHAQGFDITLGYKGKSGGFNYYGNLTASYGWNKVIKEDYAENAQDVDIPVGRSTNYIKGYRFDKIIRTQEELDAFNREHPNYVCQGVKPDLGMMVYKDISGPDGTPDGIIDSWDRVVLKKKNFPVVYGLNLGGSWKGISLDMMFSGRLGEKRFVNDLAGGVEWNRIWKKWYTDSWTESNPNAMLPKRISCVETNTYSLDSDYWLKSASFMRMKYLTLSYDLPKGMFYNKVFDGIRVFFTGTNLFVLSKFNKDYYDPEINSGNAFPVLRSFSFGIDVKI